MKQHNLNNMDDDVTITKELVDSGINAFVSSITAEGDNATQQEDLLRHHDGDGSRYVFEDHSPILLKKVMAAHPIASSA